VRQKFFSEIFPSGLSLHSYTASFFGAISTPEEKIFEKGPLSVSQWAKNSTCLRDEAGTAKLCIVEEGKIKKMH
jgi:hypothetical protein